MQPQLLAEVIAAPRSIAPRRVYADALLEAGDPRGEFIQLQCALEELGPDDPAREALEARATDLLALHEPAWTRELRDACGLHDNPFELGFRRGFVERARLRGARVREVLPLLVARTPLRELRIRTTDPARELGEVPGLVELEGLQLSGSASGEDLARALASWPHRGQLRWLEADRGAAVVHAVAGAPALAGLERLSLGSVDARGLAALAAATHLASLRALRLSDVVLDGADLDALGRSEAWPALEALELQRVRAIGHGARALARLCAARLRELRCARGTEAADALALAARARDLEVLDLEGVRISDTGALALLHGPAALARLRYLDVSDTGLSDPGLASVIAALEVPGLRRLACCNNDLSSKAAAAIAHGRALGELQQLFLARCPLGDAGVTALAASEHLPALRVVDLARTACGRGGLQALGAGELGARLISLDLGHNELGDRDLGALFAGRRLDRLERLSLDGLDLSRPGVRALAASPVAARLRALTLGRLEADAAAQLAAAELPELRKLVAGGFDDRAASILARTPGMPWLQEVVLLGSKLTDEGARALAGAAGLERIAWLELDAPLVTEAGRDALRRRFGYRVGVFSGATLHAFSSLSRRF